MTNDELIKQVDINKIAEKGAKIYEKVKPNYDPQHKGKFLAIEIDSEKVYMGDTSAGAVELAKKEHPDKIFYVIKIGSDVAETIAQSLVSVF